MLQTYSFDDLCNMNAKSVGISLGSVSSILKQKRETGNIEV